jgi:tetratricopeptide (TPR) repeat protein
MTRTLVVLVGALVSMTAVTSHAQQIVLGQLYGNGVHAYFAGDAMKAYDQLSSAIASGSSDPRAYYFRGLAYLKLGREPEAIQDFQKGAALETKDLNRSYNVGRSLERVQGWARQKLETYRVDARLAALEEADRIRKVKFETIKREEERVLRKQAAQAEVIPTPEIPMEPKEDTDLFGNPAEPKVPAAEKNADEKKAPADAAPAADNAEKEPAEEKAEMGGDSDAKDNPFKEEPGDAEKPAAEKPAAEKPAAEKPAEENPDDAFGS